jgi:predicted nucleic acid-binding protein
MIVADASLLAHLLIPGLDQASAEAVQRRDSDWRAPGLWSYEFRNVLLKYIRRGDLSQDQANQLMTRALAGMGSVWQDAPSSAVLAAAATYNISSYDGEYVALAQHARVPLVTCDKKLARAATGIALSPADFLP